MPICHRSTIRGLLSAAIAVAALASAAGCATDTPRAQPLAMADCLDPERARGWTLLANDELLVDSGRRLYHVRLSMACPELGTSPAVQFRPAGGIGRVCGNSTDAVLALGRHIDARPCPIASLRVIDRETYESLAAGKPQVALGTQ